MLHTQEPDVRARVSTAPDQLPYPVALTAMRFERSRHADVFRSLCILKDCFEASIKYTVAVLLAGYRDSRLRSQKNSETIMKDGLARPSLGSWVQLVYRLSGWLYQSDSPAGVVARYFVRLSGGGTKVTPSPLHDKCTEFVRYRNDMAHGAMRID
jgi:hypothetical protein